MLAYLKNSPGEVCDFCGGKWRRCIFAMFWWKRHLLQYLENGLYFFLGWHVFDMHLPVKTASWVRCASFSKLAIKGNVRMSRDRFAVLIERFIYYLIRINIVTAIINLHLRPTSLLFVITIFNNLQEKNKSSEKRVLASGNNLKLSTTF